MVNVRQHYLGCLAQAGYSIESDGQLFVIDPRRDVDEFVRLIEENNLTLAGVMITHLHADFVAGHQELAKKFDAPLYVGRAAGAEYPHVPLSDGQELAVGHARLVFWETPGHTPGDVSTLLFSPENGGKAPVAVFTGDTLFNGDVGRPDLLASFGLTQDELATHLFRSVQRLMTLPDSTTLYPGHGAGSLCGKSLGAETQSTIGAQRLHNYAVRAKSLEEFRSLVTTGQTEPPRYFVTDALMNKRGVTGPLANLLQKARRLSPEEARSLLRHSDDFHLVDTRNPEEFARGFLPGFLNIGLDGWFASWSGTLVDGTKPVLVVVPTAERAEEAIIRMARVGIESVQGWIPADELPLLGLPFASFEHRDGGDVRRAAEQGEVVVVDVRTPGEIAQSGGIPGAVNIPVGHFSPETLTRRLPGKEKIFVTVCAGGYRSSLAASYLVALGYRNVADLGGGYGNWPKP